MNSTHDVFDSGAPDIYQIQTRASGPAGSLPITEEMLLHSPGGDLFGMTQNAGMSWNPAKVACKQFPSPTGLEKCPVFLGSGHPLVCKELSSKPSR